MKTNAQRQAAHRANTITLTKKEALQLLAVGQTDQVGCKIKFDFDTLMSAHRKLEKALDE